MAGKKRSIADVYVSIIPETSQVASKIAQAFRETDREAREAGRRRKRAIDDELGQLAQTRNRPMLRALP